MTMNCAVCNRPIGPNRQTCPYCGGPVQEGRINRVMRMLLPLVIMLSLGVSLFQACRTAVPTGATGGPLWPRDPASAFVLALALALAWLPLVIPVAQPGTTAATLRNQAIFSVISQLLFGTAIVATAWLAAARSLSPAIWPAVIALLASPRMLRLPTYPLLAGPLAVLAQLISQGA